MQKKYALFAVLLAIMCNRASADPFLPTPPASFLNYNVSSVLQLSEQVTFDAQVRARLAHHFQVSEPQLVAYIHDNMVLTQLRTAGGFRVYSMAPNGKEYSLLEHLPAGTPIFALQNTRTPILLQSGNPVLAFLPKVGPRPVMATTPAQLAFHPTQTAHTNLIAFDGLPGNLTFTALPPLDGERILTLRDTLRSFFSVPGAGFSSGFLTFFERILTLLFSVYLGNRVFHHGHGNGNNGGGNHPPPVPEPNPALVIVIGGAALGGLGLRARKRQLCRVSA